MYWRKILGKSAWQYIGNLPCLLDIKGSGVSWLSFGTENNDRTGRKGASVFEWESHMNLFSRFVKDESGATAIEYGLIAALIAVGIIGAATLVGEEITNTFNEVSNEMKEARS